MIQYLNDSMTQSTLVRARFFFLRFRLGAWIRIEQLGEARILRQILEVGVIPRLEAQRRFYLNRLVQRGERFFDVTGQAMQGSQAVENELRLRILLQQLVEMLARRHVISDVDERNGIVVMLLSRFELQGKRFQMLVACQHVNLCPVDQRLVRTAQHLLQVAFRFFELVFLQGAQPGFIVLHCLCMSWIFGRLFLGGYLQWHRTAFSPEFSSELKSKLAPPRRRVRREKPFSAKALGAGYGLHVHSIDAGGCSQIDCLPVTLDNSSANFARRLVLLIHAVSVIELFEAGTALRPVRAREATVQAGVPHAPVAVAITRLLVKHLGNLRRQFIGMRLVRKLRVRSKKLILGQN